MPEWIALFLTELGGGAQAVMTLMLAVGVVYLWRQNQRLQDARLEDLRQNLAQMTEISVEANKSLDALTSALRASQ